MKHLKSLVSLPLLMSTLTAEAESYTLKRGQTISELLFDELNIRPIYGSDKIMLKVLKHNNLTLDKARRLPVGHKVSLPPDLIHVPEEPAFVAEKPVPEIKQEPALKSRHILGAGTGLFSYSGKSKTKGSFSASGPQGAFFYENRLPLSKLEVRSNLRGEVSYLSGSDTSEMIPGFDLSVGLLKSVDQNQYGIRLFAGRNFYLTSETGRKEKLVKGIVPGFALMADVHLEHYVIGPQLGLNLAATIDGHELEGRPFASVGVMRKLQDKWMVGPELVYEDRKMGEFDQRFLALNIFLTREL